MGRTGFRTGVRLTIKRRPGSATTEAWQAHFISRAAYEAWQWRTARRLVARPRWWSWWGTVRRVFGG